LPFALLARAIPGAVERIIGGTAVLTDGSAAGHPFPAYVQLRVRVPRLGGPASGFTCGGCIVHAWRRDAASGRHAGFWVATAAHCLDPSSAYEVNVWAGAGAAAGETVNQRDVFYGGQSGNAPGWRLLGPGGITVYRHPAFDEDTLRPDVALLRVLLPDGEDLPATLLDASSGEVAWERVPDLADPAPPTRDLPVRIVGFGKTATGASNASPTLQQAAAVLEPASFDWRPSRGDAAFYHWVVGERTLQGAGFAGPWSGDSGGPLLTVAPAGAAPRILGVLCCVFWTGDDADLARYPSQYARLQPFLGEADGAYAAGLKQDSIWRGGILKIVRDNSPVLLRSKDPSPAGDAVARDFSRGNVWVEGGAANVWEMLLAWLTLLAVTYGPAALVVAAVLLLLLGARKLARRAKVLRGRGPWVPAKTPARRLSSH
jgi:hypothetical protein